MRGALGFSTKAWILLVLICINVFGLLSDITPAKAQGIPGPGTNPPPTNQPLQLYFQTNSTDTYPVSFKYQTDASGVKTLTQYIGVRGGSGSPNYIAAGAVWSEVKSSSSMSVYGARNDNLTVFSCPSAGPFGIFKLNGIDFYSDTNKTVSAHLGPSANYYIVVNEGSSVTSNSGGCHFDTNQPYSALSTIYTGNPISVSNPVDSGASGLKLNAIVDNEHHEAYQPSTLNSVYGNNVGSDEAIRSGSVVYVNFNSVGSGGDAARYLYALIKAHDIGNDSQDINEETAYAVDLVTSQNIQEEYSKYYASVTGCDKINAPYTKQGDVKKPREVSQIKFISDLTTDLRNTLASKDILNIDVNNADAMAQGTWPIITLTIAGSTYSLPALADSGDANASAAADMDLLHAYYQGDGARYPNQSLANNPVYQQAVGLVNGARGQLFTGINVDETKNKQIGEFVGGALLLAAAKTGPAAPYVAGAAVVVLLATYIKNINDVNSRRTVVRSFVNTIYAVAYAGSVINYDTCVRDYWKNSKGDTSDEYKHMDEKITKASNNLDQLVAIWKQGAADALTQSEKSQQGIGGAITEALMYIAKLIHKGIIWLVAWIIRWTSGAVPI